MAFSYPLTMPTDPEPSAVNYRLKRAQTESRSPFSFASQVYDWGGALWEVDLEYPPMTKAQARSWIAFLMELKGQVGTFYFTPPDDRVLGVGGGTPVIDTVISTTKVNITGAPNSTNGWLIAGDWFSFANGELKRVISTVNSDGSGNAQIIFNPKSRQTPSAASQVATSAAKGIFRLSSADIEFNIASAQIHGFKLVIEEAIGV